MNTTPDPFKKGDRVVHVSFPDDVLEVIADQYTSGAVYVRWPDGSARTVYHQYLKHADASPTGHRAGDLIGHFGGPHIHIKTPSIDPGSSWRTTRKSDWELSPPALDIPRVNVDAIVAAFGLAAAKSGEVRTTSSTGGQKGVKPEMFSLIPAKAWETVARHYGIGATKYDRDQWRKGYEWSKSFDALQRHAMAFWSGEDIDTETQSPHMAAVAFHALTLLTFMDEQPDHDDRYKGATND